MTWNEFCELWINFNFWMMNGIWTILLISLIVAIIDKIEQFFSHKKKKKKIIRTETRPIYISSEAREMPSWLKEGIK